MVNYFIYIGDYLEKGNPASLTLWGKATEKDLQDKINNLKKSIKYGMEIYILNKSNHKMKAYFRDKEKCKKILDNYFTL